MISKKQFENYYKEYADKIYNFIYYKVNAESDVAYDLTSQVFYKALHKLETFDENKNFKSWIYQIAQNSIIDYYRTQKENISLDEIENLVFYYDNINEKIDTDIKLKQIYEEMNNLSAVTKQIIILKIFEELTFDEIAEVLNMTLWACKMQYKRWIDNIKSIILQLLIFFFIL